MSNTQSPTWSLPPAAGDAEGDDPLPAPPFVRELIPPFHLHGEHNCGNHRHGPGDRNAAGYLARQRRRAASAVRSVACSSCSVRPALDRMHDLPCGHMLCRSCLLLKVFAARRSMERNRSQIAGARRKLMIIDSRCDGVRGAWVDQRQKKRLRRRACELRRGIARHMGLLCCGRDIRLERFLPCLDPAESRNLWLVARWMRDPTSEHRACAWPDCGAYLPVCCRYLVLPFDTWRYSCVSCGGNSRDCDRIVREAQTEFPFLPEGQPALTPAR